MFEQVKLTYEMNALEPHIDQLTMETHYGKHHAAYTKAFWEILDWDIVSKAYDKVVG